MKRLGNCYPPKTTKSQRGLEGLTESILEELHNGRVAVKKKHERFEIQQAAFKYRCLRAIERMRQEQMRLGES